MWFEYLNSAQGEAEQGNWSIPKVDLYTVQSAPIALCGQLNESLMSKAHEMENTSGVSK